ncbi:hypothetical protein QJ857_gp1052 [Tupanvirus soda lake]|uniref:DUF11 domain-containing protein n=2 Tax=Tupanvirus TaxID=2094720 RepID=A0A6N1NXY1_9VIRU|nr:hypothetical protein QJ857_gp1052 [Tupanvirus soda lake]QKU35002.1 hypothetical protein [Tupanvirus soda lake]
MSKNTIKKTALVRAKNILQTNETTNNFYIGIGPNGKQVVIDIQPIEEFENKNSPPIRANIILTPNKTTFGPNEVFSIRVNYLNVSNRRIDKIIVSVNIGVKGKFVTIPSECIASGQKLVYNGGSLAPGEGHSIDAVYEIAEDVVPDPFYEISALIASSCECSTLERINIAVEANPAITVTKTATPSRVVSGGTVNYEVVIKNNSDVVAFDIDFIDTTNLPGEFDPIPEGFQPIIGGISSNIPILPAGQSITYNFTYKVATNAPQGDYTNHVRVKPSNGQAVETDTTVTVRESAIIDISKRIISPSVIHAGDTIIFEIVVVNSSDFPLPFVVISDNTDLPGTFDPLPPGFRRVGNDILHDIPILNPRQARSIELPFHVAENAQPGQYNNNVKASSLNNEASFTLPVTIEPRQGVPQIEISKTPDNTVPARGNTVRYEIVIRNTSNGPANNVSISDITDIQGEFTEIPAGFELVEGGFQGLINTIEEGQQVTLSTAFQISETAELGIHENTVIVRVDGGDEIREVLPIEVVPGEPKAILSVLKVPNNFNVSPGENLTYTLRIQNTSNIEAINVRLNDFNFLQGTFHDLPEGYIVDGNSFSATIGNIAANETIEIIAPFTVANNVTPGTYDNVLTVLLDNGEQNQYVAGAEVNVNEITTTTLVVTKTVNPRQVLRGQDAQFTINIKNTGNAVARNVKYVDNTTVTGDFIAIPEGASITAIGFEGTITSIEAGQEVNLNATFCVSENANFGRFANFVLVEADNAPRNETFVEIDVINRIPTLELNKTATVLNGRVNYIISIKNNSSFATENITINDISTLVGEFVDLPNGFIQNPNHNGFIGFIESLAANTTVNFDIAQLIPIGSPTANHTNTFNLKLGNIDLGSATANFHIQGPPLPILTINQTTDKEGNNYEGGETITYVIEVSNISNNIIAENVVLVDTSSVPGYFTNTPCTNLLNKQSFRCVIGDLLPGQTYIATAKYLINNGAQGKYYNKVNVESPSAVAPSKEIEINIGSAR